CFECFFVEFSILCLQRLGMVFGPKVVRVGDPLLTNLLQFFAAFGNQTVFIDGGSIIQRGHRAFVVNKTKTDNALLLIGGWVTKGSYARAQLNRPDGVEYHQSLADQRWR